MKEVQKVHTENVMNEEHLCVLSSPLAINAPIPGRLKEKIKAKNKESRRA